MAYTTVTALGLISDAPCYFPEMSILQPSTFPRSIISSDGYFVDHWLFSTLTIMLPAKRDSFISSFPNCTIFSCLGVLATSPPPLHWLSSGTSTAGKVRGPCHHVGRVEVFSPQRAFAVWGTHGATVWSEVRAGVRLCFSKSCVLLRCPSPALWPERTGSDSASEATSCVPCPQPERTQVSPWVPSSPAGLAPSERSCFYGESGFLWGLSGNE